MLLSLRSRASCVRFVQCNDCFPSSNSVNGHVSTVSFTVCCGSHSQASHHCVGLRDMSFALITVETSRVSRTKSRTTAVFSLGFQTLESQTLIYNVPDVVRPIYLLSDREDSQAYHLKWRKLRLMHLCRSENVST